MAQLPQISRGECFLRPPIMPGSICPPKSGQSSLGVEIILLFCHLLLKLPQKTIIHPAGGPASECLYTFSIT